MDGQAVPGEARRQIAVEAEVVAIADDRGLRPESGDHAKGTRAARACRRQRSDSW